MTPVHALRLLDTVALLADVPECGLLRGQVGTLVDQPAEGVWLVEFSDDEGRAYAVPALRDEQVIVLRFAAAQAA